MAALTSSRPAATSLNLSSEPEFLPSSFPPDTAGPLTAASPTAPLHAWTELVFPGQRVRVTQQLLQAPPTSPILLASSYTFNGTGRLGMHSGPGTGLKQSAFLKLLWTTLNDSGCLLGMEVRVGVPREPRGLATAVVSTQAEGLQPGNFVLSAAGASSLPLLPPVGIPPRGCPGSRSAV